MCLFRKSSLTLLAVLLFALLIANLIVFFTRDWEASFYPASYATLYYPLDKPTVRQWKLIDTRLIEAEIAWNRPVQGWSITSDSLEPQISSGNNPVFRLADDELIFHTYAITPIPEEIGKGIELTTRYISKEYYSERGMKHTDVYSIDCNAPCGNFKQYPVSYWTDDYSYVGEAGLAEADRLIAEAAGIRGDEPTLVKMEKLTRFLRRQLIHARGVPKDDFRWMNPWLIYQEMVAGTGKGWCTQHGQIYVFFANRAGIPTRLMLGARTQDNNFVYTGHTWAESWIAEQQRWAFVDLSHSHIAILNKNGQVLNTAELFFLNQHDSFDSTFARIYQDWEWKHLQAPTGPDSLATVPFALCNRVVREQFTAHSILKYRRPPNVEDVRTLYRGLFKDAAYGWGNIERYLFKPPLAFSFYPTEGKSTYIVRWVLFYSLAAVLFLFLIIAVRCRWVKK